MHAGPKNSIMKKLLLPIIAVMTLQSGLFLGIILWGGTLDQLNNNAFDILNQRVINRQNYVENDMIQRWSEMSSTSAAISLSTAAVLRDRRADAVEITQNVVLSEEMLARFSEDLISLIRKNSVTGGFIILGTEQGAQGQAVQRPCIYIRNPDPTTSTKDNSDLLITRGPVSVTRRLGISLDTRWETQLTTVNDGTTDFFDKPFFQAFEHPEIGVKDLGYWCGTFSLDENDIPVVTYSEPLRMPNGTVVGVMGIELSIDYLRTRIPFGELDENRSGAYALAVDNGVDKEFQTVVSSGPFYTQLFGDSSSFRLEQNEYYNNCFRLAETGRVDEEAYGCVRYFNLYNTNTPFENERWALVGIMSKDNLLGFSQGVRTSLLAALAIALSLGVAAVFFAGQRFAAPITGLVKKLRESDPSKPVNLEAIHVWEIDELSSAIEYLSKNVADAASRLSKIVDMAGIPIGAFEYQFDTEQVFYSGRLFELLGLPLPEEGCLVTADQYHELLEPLFDSEPDCDAEHKGESERIIRVQQDATGMHWVRLRSVRDADRLLGVVTDVTNEVLERRKIEHERDYDLLTGLYNRRAFVTEMERLFNSPGELWTCALIMLDLDNLKYINDTYGHDFGDKYIRNTAVLLRRYSPRSALVCRISGDEFHIFFYGYKDKREVRELIRVLQDGIRNAVFPLPGNDDFKVRASAGVAWYPDDADSYETLMRYADFAMYQVKNTTKGEFSEFDREVYNRDSYLLHSKEELNRLIDSGLVNYCFQPIVSAKDGEIFAYEALMRSGIASLKSPVEILTLARSQFKLYQIERLTWTKSFESFLPIFRTDPTCRLFINSISNQCLTDDDVRLIEGRFGNYLHRIVIELTEGEKLNEVCTEFKRRCAERWNAQIALDDYGTGYNSDVALLSLTPDYVKIDMSIVRDIDTDLNRQKILENLLSYSRGLGIHVIAEGVETYSEMDTLIRFGVDFIQGFYVSKPEFHPQPIQMQIKQTISETYQRYRKDGQDQA